MPDEPHVCIGLYLELFLFQVVDSDSEPSDTDAVEIVNDDPQSPSYDDMNIWYSLKVINPSKKSEYRTVRLQGQKVCTTLDGLKEFIDKGLPVTGDNLPPVKEVEIGYLEPGHGAKGKRCWLYTDDDLKEMYGKHKGKKELLLWCYSHKTESLKPTAKCTAVQPKEKETNVAVVRSSKYDNHTKKMAEVDQIFGKLEDQHCGKYSPEQLRAWAHMIQMSKQDSYEVPPDKPFFCGHKQVATDHNVPESKCSAPGLFPGRRVNMRGELIDQLQKLQGLVDGGTISEEQYKELKQTVLNDIKGL